MLQVLTTESHHHCAAWLLVLHGQGCVEHCVEGVWVDTGLKAWSGRRRWTLGRCSVGNGKDKRLLVAHTALCVRAPVTRYCQQLLVANGAKWAQAGVLAIKSVAAHSLCAASWACEAAYWCC
jgi:hypothetical protein